MRSVTPNKAGRGMQDRAGRALETMIRAYLSLKKMGSPKRLPVRLLKT